VSQGIFQGIELVPWEDLVRWCEGGTPQIVRAVPAAPDPVTTSGFLATWAIHGATVRQPVDGQIHLTVAGMTNASCGLSPAGARLLAAVLLDQADVADELEAADRG
jgi:hypothetical protein